MNKSALDSFLLDRKNFFKGENAESDAAGEKLRRMAQRALQEVVREELSSAQKKYLAEYYFEGKTLKEIADLYGVNISTVSRTISRGRKRIIDRIKYYFIRI